MLIEEKPLAGVLNTDDPEWNIPNGHHSNGRNIRFRGNAGNMRAEDILGTILIANADLPGTGTNITIGAFYDTVKQRVFYFNYSSIGTHGIYILNLLTNTIATLIQVGAGTDGDILDFTLTSPIFDAQIIYGDSEQGDIIYWRNCQNEPCKINVDRQLAAGYGVVLRDYLKVIKAPFDTPPLSVYQDDASVTINNMRKGVLFIFKTRAIYDDNDTSVWSAWSKVAIPVDANDLDVNADPTKNAKIGLVIETGANNVKKIEIAAAQNLGAQWGDFFSVDILHKDKLSLGNNDITTYYFFNDKSYNYIDAKESVELYDLVPIYTLAQGLLNGNVLDYANITEGYNPLATLSTTAVTVTSIDNYRTEAKGVMGVIQGGTTLSVLSNNIHIIVIGAITTGDVFTIQTTTQTISYTAVGGDDATDVIDGLAAAAVIDGFTVDIQTANDLVIHKTNEFLIRYYVAPVTSTDLGDTDCTPVYDWASVGSLALEYFDKDGRTIGAQTKPELSFQTLEYAESAFVPKIPELNASIYHRPPLEAWYYSWSRTKDLSKLRQLQWITDRTFKDTAPSADGNSYAYLSIENLNQYITANPVSSFLTYDFSKGDRVRFIKSYADLTNPSLVYTNKDYALQGQVIDPIINGLQHQGQFVKLFLPTTDIFFDFGVTTDFTVDWNNYFIELYSPALSVAEGLNRYLEFGEKYAILNPETSNRCHQGMLQNQSTNLATPATFIFTQGDYYLRQRTITATPIYKFTLPPTDELRSLDFIPMSLTQSFDIVGYDVKSQGGGHLSGTFFDSTNWFIDVTDGNTYTFTITGNITTKTLNSSTTNYVLQVYYIMPPATFGQLNLVTSAIPTISDQETTYSINTTLVIPAGFTRVFFYFFSTDNDLRVQLVSGDLSITAQGKTFSQLMIDGNFSDNYESKVNANGRTFIVDPNAKQREIDTLIRWGLPYQVNTNINQTNRFYSENFDEIDESRGAIRALRTRARTQRVFQTRATGIMGVYAKFIQDSNGQNTLTTTDDIITKNNIQYYNGEHGIGNHPEGIVSSAMYDYFVDPVTGDQIRVGENGLISINRIYKGDYYIRSLLVPYNKTWTRSIGGNSLILGAFDFLENQYICVLQSGTNGDDTIGDYIFSFDEKRNAYCCFNDYVPEWVLGAQDFIISFKNGNAYLHNDTVHMNTFYGVNYASTIELVYNKDIPLHKKQLSFGYQSNQIWTSPTNGDIVTSYYNQQTGFQQISQLKSVDYTIEEGKRVAAFLRDANSGSDARLALLEGEYLEGNWLKIKLSYTGNSSAWIFAPYVKYILSNVNP